MSPAATRYTAGGGADTCGGLRGAATFASGAGLENDFCSIGAMLELAQPPTNKAHHVPPASSNANPSDG